MQEEEVEVAVFLSLPKGAEHDRVIIAD